MFFLKRADGWCESVKCTYESLLEQSMEHLKQRLVITFGFSRYLYKWKVYFLYFQLGWHRGLTLVPFLGTGVFCVHFKKIELLIGGIEDVRFKIFTK